MTLGALQGHVVPSASRCADVPEPGPPRASESVLAGGNPGQQTRPLPPAWGQCLQHPLECSAWRREQDHGGHSCEVGWRAWGNAEGDQCLEGQGQLAHLPPRAPAGPTCS